MDNLNLLIEILTTEHEYWCVTRRNESYRYARTERLKDSIMLVSIPQNVRRGLKKEEILLTDIEALQRADLPNIFFNEPYAPFQYGITMRNVYYGFPIVENIKQFMIDALNAKNCKSIYDYKELIQVPSPIQSETEVSEG